MRRNLKHLICLLTCVLFLGSAYAQSKAYVRGSFPPWGQNTNELAMDIAFGGGNWNNFTNFNTPADLWTPTYDVVFLEGGDGTANQLEAYLNANLPAIEAWVNAGGNLLLNAAPNQGNGMSYGFGGVTLQYPSFVPNASSPTPGHPIFAGPAPTQDNFTGNFYGHAVICPAGMAATVLMENQVNAAQDVAVEACFGGGTVIFGGMTTTNWHQPTLLARNLRANMLSYLGTSPCGGGGGGGADCYDNDCVTVVCPPDVTVQCIEDFTPDPLDATATANCMAGAGGGGGGGGNCTGGQFQAMDSQNITISGQNFNFSFAGAPAPAGDATVTFCVQGDFNGGGTETATLFDENNNPLVTIGGPPIVQCAATPTCQTLNIPQATVATWALDGMIDFLSDNGSGVSGTLCNVQFNSLEISYSCTAGGGGGGGGGPLMIVGQWVTQPHQTGGDNCDGTTYVYTYKAADNEGNIGCCDQVVTIVNAAPTISVPMGGTVTCFDEISVSPGDATVTTSCGEELDVTIYAPVINGEPNCTGTTYTYTYRVEDQCEREATADRVFTVGAGADPIVTAPDNVTCECLAGVNAWPHNADVTTTCGVDADVAVTGPVISGPIDCPGTTYTYSYNATDACDRTGSASQTFTVSNGPPVLENCPANCLILNCEDEGWEDVIQAWLASVSAKTSCGQPLTVFNNYNPNTQGVCISNGTTNVTWRTTDNCGRTSTCSSMIIINDTEPPIFIEEAQGELDICNYNTPHEFDAWVDSHGGAVVIDCDDNITNNQWSTIPNNPSINCNGAMGPTSVTVTFVVRDDCGNKSSSTATFTALMAGGDLVEDGDEPASEVTTQTFELNQNQPNPFSNETMISFTLPTQESATLTIYDMSGKVVKLIQGDFSEGYNEVQISRSELSGAGMLYYELSTTNDTAVKKMIIVD